MKSTCLASCGCSSQTCHGSAVDTNWVNALNLTGLDPHALSFNGQPSYVDLYGRVGHQVGANTRVSLNVLSFEDDLQIFDSDQEEQAEADYRDEYYWLTVDYGSPQSQGGRLLAAHTRLTSERSGNADLPGIGSGSLQDRRRFEINSVQLDTWWPLPGTA